MTSVKLIADSGATKTEWCLLNGRRKKLILTQGISTYFLAPQEIKDLLLKELKPKIKPAVNEIHFYGTGLFDPANKENYGQGLAGNFSRPQKQVSMTILPGQRGPYAEIRRELPVTWEQEPSPCYYDGKKNCQEPSGARICLR
jgi:hypothetical protein